MNPLNQRFVLKGSSAKKVFHFASRFLFSPTFPPDLTSNPPIPSSVHLRAHSSTTLRANPAPLTEPALSIAEKYLSPPLLPPHQPPIHAPSLRPCHANAPLRQKQITSLLLLYAPYLSSHVKTRSTSSRLPYPFKSSLHLW